MEKRICIFIGCSAFSGHGEPFVKQDTRKKDVFAEVSAVFAEASASLPSGEGKCSGSGEDLQKVKRLKRNLQIKGCQFHLSLRLLSKSLRDRTSDQGIPGTLGFGRLKHRIAFLRKEAQNHTQKKGESCQTCRPRVLGVLFWHHAPAR